MQTYQNRWLPVRLTDTETLDYGRTMSERVKERSELEAEKAARMREFGENLKKLNGEINRLSVAISTGEEHRNVRCIENKSIALDECTVTRCDTGEVISVRKLLDHEKQQNMFADAG